ncbi:MAG: 3-hydroxybutyryl-CoA dehydrogenase [Pseudomonadota bacterium]
MITTIGVVGAGQMGGGIAQVAAQNGFHVVLHDVRPELVGKGKSAIEKSLSKLVEKQKITEAQKTEAISRIQTTTDLGGMSEAQLIVEAATEKIEIKLEMFRALDQKTAPGTILASNTSSIPITQLAGATKRPGKVIGMHFMNPVPVMKLVEIIRGKETSDETLKAVLETAQKMGKDTVTSADSPGFIVNRVLMPLIHEAIFTLETGVATAADIDKAMKLGTNQPMGPLELADLIGLDTVLSIIEVMHKGLKDEKFRPSPLLRKYVTEGRLGRKSGRGFFEYGTR